jgi:hypothetical protein
MANIFVSVPILGKPELKMMYSLYQSILSCPGHRIRLYYNENDSLISRVRNVHLSIFFYEYPECDYFVSLDSDLEIVNCFASNNIFAKLIGCQKEFVGGLYALKMPGEVKCSSIPMEHDKRIHFDSGLVEMRWLSSGCWCLHRSVVKKMIDAYPDLTYNGDDNASGKKIHALYMPAIYSMDDPHDPSKKFKKYLSEDWSFCQRWKGIGGEIFADTSIALRHIGKTSFSLWDVSAQEKQRVATPPSGFDLAKGVQK